MDQPAYTSMRAAILALFVLAAPYAHANMYRWIGEDGSVTYSTEPPADPSRVSELTRLVNPPPPAPAPAKPPPQAATEKIDPLFVFVPPAPRTPAPSLQPELANVPRDLPTARMEPTVRMEPATRPDAPPAEAQRTESPSPRLVYRGAPGSAAQDPCLRSSDPRCYERNKERYHPFLGYTRGGAPVVGATTGGTAGGAVGGSSTR